MSQLIQLKHRIKSIATIKKITQTMRLIAISTHSKLKKQSDSLQYLKKELKSLLCSLDTQATLNQPDHVPAHKTLFIICASEKGLCGTFNSTMFAYFNKHLTSEALINSHVISIGKKASQYLEQRNITPIVTFEKVLPNRLDIISQEIYQKIILLRNDYQEIICFSSVAKTFVVQEAKTTKLLPIQQDPCALSDATINFDDYLWRQDQKDIVLALHNMLLKITILALLTNAILAEQSARFLSMDNATRNAKSLQKSMLLTFNKVRQAKITRELIELISGF